MRPRNITRDSYKFSVKNLRNNLDRITLDVIQSLYFSKSFFTEIKEDSDYYHNLKNYSITRLFLLQNSILKN